MKKRLPKLGFVMEKTKDHRGCKGALDVIIRALRFRQTGYELFGMIKGRVMIDEHGDSYVDETDEKDLKTHQPGSCH